ncbi:MAG TPA: folylpolyglutamate synthase/dihydrofolate synthase family protein [Pyrinomonadaceae bacterium]
MNFAESLQYLYNLGFELSVKKFGLENSQKLLETLNHPEQNFLKVQVAGTNGKGSVCAFLHSICIAAGIKTGLNTSPHLVSVNERIKIDKREITEKDFARQVTKIKEISEKALEKGELNALPTFFEHITAIALSYFAEEKAGIVILETGLGGRFDATTAANAEIVAITPIDYDHTKTLGETLTDIASEKSAIIRKDTRVVLARQKQEAQNVISKVCSDLRVTPQTTDFAAEIVETKDFGKYVVDFETEKARYENVCLNLRGLHQIENAKTAVRLAEALQENFEISVENIVEGLQRAVHKGRLEFYKNILFDGAHNASGARALRAYLDEFIKKPVTMIFGAMRDKNLSEIGGLLFPKADVLIFAAPDNPRASETSELINFLPENFDRKNVFEAESVEDALKKALEISPSENLICVTGSLYLVGEAQKVLINPSF